MTFCSTAVAKILQQLLNSKQKSLFAESPVENMENFFLISMEKFISEVTQTKFILALEER